MQSKINQAIKYIIEEKLVAVPTDTYFALSANGLSARAIKKIYYAKGRDYSSPIPLLISSQDMAKDISKNLSDLFFKLTEKFWPGPLTVVVDANENIPEIVKSKSNKVGIRIPSHKVCLQIIKESNLPISGTSCNISGMEPSKNYNFIKKNYTKLIDFVLEVPCGIETAPSTVVEINNDSIKILRLGAIKKEAINKHLPEILIN
ncbi:MAG: threonylcarbamoyl-AMP synthase [Chloroflexi bacterium]|nr:threonylcarbamoyl-AMP synthase [Chloroflexota bacterium]